MAILIPIFSLNLNIKKKSRVSHKTNVLGSISAGGSIVITAFHPCILIIQATISSEAGIFP